MTDYNHGPHEHNWLPALEGVQIAFSSAVSEVMASRKLTAKAAFDLIMANMPGIWTADVTQPNFWGHYDMWLGIKGGSWQGDVGAAEGAVWWPVPSHGSDANERADADISAFYAWAYKTGRLEPLAIAKQKALAEAPKTSVQIDPSTASKSLNGLPEKRATLDQPPPAPKDVSGGALAAAAAATIASVVGISWLISKLVKRARSG